MDKYAGEFLRGVGLVIFGVPILLFYLALWVFYLKDKKPIYQEGQ